MSVPLVPSPCEVPTHWVSTSSWLGQGCVAWSSATVGGLGRDSNAGHGTEEGSGLTPMRAGSCWVIFGTWPSPTHKPSGSWSTLPLQLCSCALSVWRRGVSRPASSSLRFLEAPSSFSEAGHSCASSPVVRAGVFWLLMGIVCLFVAGLFWFFFCGFEMLVCRSGGAWHPWRVSFFRRVSPSLL